MKKNTIFIIAIVTTLMLVILFLAFLSAKKKQSAEKTPPVLPAPTLPFSPGATKRTIESPQAVQQFFRDISKGPIPESALSNGIERTRFKNSRFTK